MSEIDKREPARSARRLALFLLAAFAGPAAVAGNTGADAVSAEPFPETRELAAVEWRIEALESHRRPGPLSRRAMPLEDPRLQALERRLAGLAGSLEPGAEEVTARAAALRSRLEAARKSPVRSVSPEPGTSAAPGNDTCTSATAIGNGSFSGNTAGAGSDGNASCGESDYSPDVWFKYTAPSTGNAFFNTLGSSYDTVLSLHSSCPGTSGNEIDCNDDAGSRSSELLENVTAGQVLYIRVSGYAGDTGPFVLNTGLGGSISGTLTEAGSGTPIASGQVIIYRAQAGRTDFIDSDLTAGDGSYSVEGLSPGTYRAIARSSLHVNELYDDIPCPGGINSCFPERGAPIPVAASTDTPGIDFELTPGGSISGTVTGAGAPLPGASVGVYDASGNFIFNDLAAADGSYTVGGLPDGQYFVATRYGTAPYADEIYDNLDCPGGGGSGGCPIRAGTPVSVTAPNDTPGIDLDLALGGAISGTVSEVGSGTPLADVDVEIYDAQGNYLGSTTTAAGGGYSYDGLHSGSYRAVTFFASPHVDEAWNDVACFGGAPFGCLATDGSPISVTAPATTSGIDFQLIEGGAVSGTVTEQGSATALPNISVELYSAAGDYLDFDRTVGDGSWEISGLPSGSYRVQTFDSAPYADELYNDISCPGGYCDVAPGTAVPVTAPADTTGIDFALTMGGAISGTVTEDGTGASLADVEIALFDAGGKYVGGGSSAADGSYVAGGLPSGSYYVSTADAPQHLDELHAGIPCPGGGGFGCTATSGTAVGVTAPSVVTGIDFALAAGGSISGSVKDAVTLLPVKFGSEVKIYGAAGAPLTSVLADGAGNYSTSGLPSGTYYARVTNDAGYQNRRYDGLSCAGTCDPELGMPITVSFPATTSGIDFRLYLPGADPDLVLSKEDLSADGGFCARSSITLGPDLEILGSAVLSFLSDEVVVASGFGTGAGTRVEFGGDPPAVCD